VTWFFQGERLNDIPNDDDDDDDDDLRSKGLLSRFVDQGMKDLKKGERRRVGHKQSELITMQRISHPKVEERKID
jgi:hypothetical protein